MPGSRLYVRLIRSRAHVDVSPLLCSRRRLLVFFVFPEQAPRAAAVFVRVPTYLVQTILGDSNPPTPPRSLCGYSHIICLTNVVGT